MTKFVTFLVIFLIIGCTYIDYTDAKDPFERRTAGPHGLPVIKNMQKRAVDAQDDVRADFPLGKPETKKVQKRSVSASAGDSHLVCEDTSMTLFLDRSLLENHGVASDVHFEDQSCVGYDYDNERVAITTRYDRCSTRQHQTTDSIVFTNIVTYFKPSSVNGSVITRDFRLHIPVTCLLKRNNLLDSFFKPKVGVNVFTAEGNGTFNMSLDRFTDDTFSQRPADESEEIRLGEPLYFGANLRAVTDLTLLILNCWATPTINDLGQPQYQFIANGCARDPTVHFHNNLGPMFKGFDIEAFTFIGEYDEVYVHCEVVVCDNTDPVSTCAQGCVSRSKRSVGSPGSRSKPHTISNGPLASRSSDRPSGGSSDDSWLTNLIKMAAIGSVGFVLAIIGVAIYMKIGRRHKSRGYRRVDQEGQELE